MKVGAKLLEKQAQRSEQSANRAWQKAVEEYKKRNVAGARMHNHERNQNLQQKQQVAMLASKMSVIANQLEKMVQYDQINATVSSSLKTLSGMLNPSEMLKSTSNMDKLDHCLADIQTQVGAMVSLGEQVAPSSDAQQEYEEQQMQEIADAAAVELTTGDAYATVPRSHPASSHAAAKTQQTAAHEHPQAEAVSEGSETARSLQQQQQQQQHEQPTEGSSPSLLDQQEDEINARLARLRRPR